MNYIYDIILNFNNDYYEFYEWYKNDTIINVRKIPVFKVCNEIYFDFKVSKVKVAKSFLDLIANQTTYYSNSLNCRNLAILTNQKEAMGVMFDKEGNIIKRSSLLFDEEDEILEIATELKETIIEYKLLLKNCNNEYLSRNEKEKKKTIINKLKKLEEEKNILALQYLYYDYFEREEKDFEVIIKSFKEELASDWNNNKNNLYKLIILLSSNKIYK